MSHHTYRNFKLYHCTSTTQGVYKSYPIYMEPNPLVLRMHPLRTALGQFQEESLEGKSLQEMAHLIGATHHFVLLSS